LTEPTTEEVEEFVVDTYSQDSAHTTNGLKPTILQTFTAEEKVTYRFWARTVMFFYCALFLLGGIAVLVNQASSNSNNVMAQVSHPQNVR
jgi:hypothetical protein